MLATVLEGTAVIVESPVGGAAWEGQGGRPGLAESAGRVPVAWQHCPGLADTAQGGLQGRTPLGESGCLRRPCHPDPQAVFGDGRDTHQVVRLLLGGQMLTRNECFSRPPAVLCVQLFNFPADNNQPLVWLYLHFLLRYRGWELPQGKSPFPFLSLPCQCLLRNLGK